MPEDRDWDSEGRVAPEGEVAPRGDEEEVRVLRAFAELDSSSGLHPSQIFAATGMHHIKVNEVLNRLLDRDLLTGSEGNLSLTDKGKALLVELGLA